MPLKNARRNPTRAVQVGSIQIGGGAPIAVQSMAATKTQNIDATVRQVELIQAAGADLVRIAVDSKADVRALSEVRDRTRPTGANLSVDLQESYRLITDVAPFVDKVRYNPGHLHHHEKDKSIEEKVAFIAEEAERLDVALRVGVNCGSVDPVLKEKFGKDDVGAMVESALQHTRILDDLGFTRYVVSMKDSDWRKVVEGNRRFAIDRPEIPLHLGVTEAGRLRPTSPHTRSVTPRARKRRVIRRKASGMDATLSQSGISPCTIDQSTRY